MKILIFIGLTICLTSALLTTSKLEKSGFKIDGKMDIVKTVPQAITTSCTNVPLGQSPYNWNSIFFH